MNFPLASLARPPARHPTVAGFRSPSFRPPLHQHAHFRHRSAPVFATLRPAATVAAWHPGPTAPVRGKASIPPGVVSTGSGAAVRRDLSGFVSACIHPCPENGPFQMFLHISSASTGPASFLAAPDHASAIRKSNKVQKEAATAPEVSGSGRCRSTFQAVFSVVRPLAGSVKKIIVVAPAALGFHPGSSVFRRQPARLLSAPIRITPL